MMTYTQIAEAFDNLSPKDKALFIDCRIAWASGGNLCAEVTQRICKPTSDN